jgi:glycosyltransferase involved in cell wall biosynthesis
MRILMVTNGFPPVASAGVESHTYALARELHLAGFSVHIFCRDADFSLPMYTVRDTVVDGLPVTRVVNNLVDAYAFEDFYRNPHIDAIYADLLAHFQPDIVHIQHCIGLSMGCLEQSVAAGIPTLVTLHDYWYICPTVNLIRPDFALCAGSHHGMNCFDCIRMVPRPAAVIQGIPFYPHLQRIVPEPIRHQAWRLLSSIQQREQAVAGSVQPIIDERVEQMRALLAGADLILSPSHHLKNKYVEFGIDPQQIRVVPLGMDVDRWLDVVRPPRPGGTPLRFGYAGSFLPTKGADIAIKAFKQVQGNMTLELVGFEPPGSPYPAQLKALMADDPRITYGGAVPNHTLPERFARWDALLMPALWEETFSFVAREALLTGLPVIASDMPVLPEIIEPGKNGFLLPPGDVSAWAAQFRDLLLNPAPLLSLNPRADTSFARTFTDHAVEQIGIYRQLLSTR